MTVLTPEEIGVLIYAVGGWGPGKPYQNADAASRAAVVKWLDTAIAVAYGESGWDTNAKNGSSSASGLYQVLAKTHAAKISQSISRWAREDGVQASELSVFDPRVNIDVARMISVEAARGGRDMWSPWQAYTTKSGGYKSGLGHGERVYKYLSDPTKIASVYDDLVSKRIVPPTFAGAKGSSTADGKSTNILGAAGAILANPDAVAGAVLKSDPISRAIDAARQAGVAVGVFLLALVLVLLGAWFLISQTKAGKTIKSAGLMAATKGIVK